jgi:hypothetical protein
MRKMRRRTTEPWDYYAVREGGTGVVIVQHPLGLSIRG